MRRIRIYRHPQSAKCANYARIHRFFDWFGQVHVSTATPATGPLGRGAMVVEEVDSGRIMGGADALECICQVIPAYLPLLPLLKIPALRAWAGRGMSGGTGSTRGLPRPRP
ncbi:MAG TPA: hypothetical protein VGN70_01830 [Gammaproteobacteria bacterium]|jgi:hypothetical protein